MTMIDFTCFSFQGRLTDDPTINDLPGTDRKVCRFTVASNKRIGKDKEKTAFIPVSVFGRDAENCYKYLSKGRGVYVTGEFETDSYIDKNDIKRKGFTVTASRVEFGPGGTKEDEDFSLSPEILAKARALLAK